MIFTIEKMKNTLEYQDEKGRIISSTGYAFIDECGNTIIIVYGEGRKDDMTKYLSGDGDPVHLKYKCFKI